MAANTPNPSSDESPWSRDVPISQAPVEFSWATTGDEDLDDPDVASAEAGRGVGGLSAANEPSIGPGASRNRNVAIGGLAVVMLLVAGWLTFGREDAAVDDSQPVQTGGAGSLPTIGEPTTDPAEDDIDADPDADAGAGAGADVDVDDDDDDGDEATGGPGTPDGDESGDDSTGADVSTFDSADWREDTVELPQMLLDSAVPFQLVAVSSVGDYLEVDVPAGRVTRFEVDGGASAQVIAGETVTLLINHGTADGSLIRVGEPPLDLDLPRNLNIDRVRSGDEFTGPAYGNDGEVSLVTVMADGSVTATSGDEDLARGFWPGGTAPDGADVVTEAGGVYIGGDDGFERISTGFLISVSTNHVLVRDCDAAMQCGYATIDFESRERVDVILDREFGAFGFDSAQLSPDGTWLHYIAYGESSADEVLVDLASGAETVLDFGGFGGFGSDTGGWAADSSGYFRASQSGGFEFFVVETGESIVFGEQFGRIASFDIRTTSAQPAPPLRAPTTTGVSLIALTATGNVAEIDVDSAAVITVDGPGLNSEAPVTIVPDAAGATLFSSDNVPSLRFVATEREVFEIAETGPGGLVWPGPQPGTFWQGDGSADSLALEVVDILGTSLGQRIELDTVGVNDVIGSDGRGGVVVRPPLGGIFALSAANDPERITDGELLAINSTVAYVRECDDGIQCGAFVVDRASGVRTAVDNTGLERAGDIVIRGAPSGQNVSPDGSVVLVRDTVDPTRCLMIDITASSGAWTGVPCVDIASPIVWTADSGYAVWLAQGAVTVYDRSTRSVRVVNTVELKAIAAVRAGEAPPAPVTTGDR